MSKQNVFESFESFFNKKYTYTDKVKSSLLNLLMNEYGISEKSFKIIDDLIEKMNNFLSDKNDIISDFENNNRRSEYCAEKLYDEYLKNNKLI